jgi:ABC-type multidrug transport system fused ATPase/permease subunit
MLVETYVKLLAMFTPRERRGFFALCALMVVMGVVEAAGVASILPFLAVVANPSVIETNDVLRRAYELSGAQNQSDFLLLLGTGVFAIFMISLAMRSLTLYASSRFAQMRGFSFATRLMTGYLRKPYVWHLGRNSADLAKTILNETNTVIGGSLQNGLTLLRHGIVALFLVGLLVVVDPVVAVVAAVVLGGCYVGFYALARRYLTRIGEDRIAATRERFRIAQEGFGGFKEIKTLGLENSYAHRFRSPSLRIARYTTAQAMIGELPRNLLEAVAFGGMLTLVLVKLAAHDEGLATLLPTLGLYAFAGVRLFPAMQTLYMCSTGLKYNYPALEELHQEIIELEEQAYASLEYKKTSETIGLTREIALSDVRFTYKGVAKPALDGLSLTIPANASVGFVGGTGAGKTTAVDVIMGLLFPEAGELRVDGVRIDESNVRAWRRSVGYVPQQIYLTDDSVAGNIAFGVPTDNIDMAAVERAARIAELHRFVTEELPQGYATLVGERGVRLSGGQRQRIGIARALYHDPDVLVLDEATSALDNLTEQAVMEAVRNIGHAKTVIMIAHRLTTVQHCDRIFLLERGRISASGTYEELVQRSEMFRRMAGRAAE